MRLCSPRHAAKTDGSRAFAIPDSSMGKPLTASSESIASRSCVEVVPARDADRPRRRGQHSWARVVSARGAGRRTASNTRATRDDVLLMPLVLFATLVLLTNHGGGAAGFALVSIMHAATLTLKLMQHQDLCDVDPPAAARSITLEDAGCVASSRTLA
jgi:hypothetical protein